MTGLTLAERIQYTVYSIQLYTQQSREIEIGGKKCENERCTDKVMDEKGPFRLVDTPKRENNFCSHLFKLLVVSLTKHFTVILCVDLFRVCE